MNKYNISVDFGDGRMTDYKDHYLIKNLEEYNEYRILLNNSFKVSESEIKNNRSWIDHGHSLLTGIAGIGCGMIEDKEERTPMLLNLKLLEASVLTGQLKNLLAGDVLLINNNGGYFPIKKEWFYIAHKIDSDVYLESDVKINKWYGGKHYYAKIKRIDVVGEDDSVKWNTEQQAREEALKYLVKLNS